MEDKGSPPPAYSETGANPLQQIHGQTPGYIPPTQSYAQTPQSYAQTPQSYAQTPQSYAQPPEIYAQPLRVDATPQSQAYASPPGLAPPDKGHVPPPQGCPTCMGQTTTVVVQQPLPGATSTNSDTVPNYVCPALLVCLFCCCPLGICALSQATLSRSRLADGDVKGASDLAKSARNFIMGSLVCGIISFLILIARHYFF